MRVSLTCKYTVMSKVVAYQGVANRDIKLENLLLEVQPGGRRPLLKLNGVFWQAACLCRSTIVLVFSCLLWRKKILK